jgi:uncharacterized protein YdhG (YjbR/CyaY superfamily)
MSSQTIDSYIQKYPEDIQKILQKIRKIMQEEVPYYEEIISYGIPTFKKDGTYVVYFAGFKKHISVYPATEELPKELHELLQYKTGAGTFQFPLEKEIPFELIRKFTKFRVKKHEEKRR